MRLKSKYVGLGTRLSMCLVFAGLPVWAQSSATPRSPATPASLEDRLEKLSESLEQTRLELSESREEIRQLRGMLEQILEKSQTAQVTARAPDSSGSGAPQPAFVGKSQSSGTDQFQSQQPAEISSDDWQIINARIEEQAQDKVESSLKYRLKLSGIVLFNAFNNTGQVDNSDVPSVAVERLPGQSSGGIGASLRQSIIGLEGIGPEIFGARTSGAIQMDFFGGLPAGYGSNTSGIARLRIARIRMDWQNTSLIAGLDAPFFSPNSPTSFMSLATPEFAAAGNLWAWAPTIRVEQRFDTPISQFKVEAGVLDPPSYSIAIAGERSPTPSEASRRPVTAVRVSMNGRNENRPLSFGVSGVYIPQTFASGEFASGWGALADWNFPVLAHVSIAGEFFTGKGLDAFGGVPASYSVGQTYSYQYVSAPGVAAIGMIGGWSQVKYRLNSRHEFTAGVGTGNWNSGYLRYQVVENPSLSSILFPRNEMFFANYIYRPRSDLVFSGEYRRLRTYPTSGAAAIAGQFGLAAGFLF
jgi:hypothetical protein